MPMWNHLAVRPLVRHALLVCRELGLRAREASVSQRGMSIIEVMIAVLIIAAAGAGVARAVGGAGTTLVRTEAQGVAVQAAETQLDRLLRNSSSWVAGCATATPTSPCSLSAPTGDPNLTATASAVGVDAQADGVGAADRDQVRPDYFLVTVTVTGSGLARPVTLTGNTEAPGRSQGGTVRVRVCVADNQIDERIVVDNCSPAAAIRMPLPILGAYEGGSNSNRDIEPYSYAYSHFPSLLNVNVRPVGGASCNLDGAPISVAGNGVGTSGFVAAGRRRLSCSAPPGYEVWMSKTKPAPTGPGTTATSYVTIEDRRQADALVVFKPQPVSLQVRMATIHYAVRTTGDVEVFMPWDRSSYFDRSPRQFALKVIPAPYGRAPMPPAAAPSDVRANFPAVEPGFYTNTILAGDRQGYLYNARPTGASDLPVTFLHHHRGATQWPLEFFYLRRDGSILSFPSMHSPGNDTFGRLWFVRWYCHGRYDISPFGSQFRTCPTHMPIGRQTFRLGDDSGKGGT